MTPHRVKAQNLPAEKIAGWFAEWKRRTGNPGRMPSPAECEPIAAFLDPERRQGFVATANIIRRLVDPVYAEAQGYSEMATAVRNGRRFRSKMLDVINDAQTLSASISRLSKILEELGAAHNNLEIKNLEVALSDFLNIQPPRHRGRPTSGNTTLRPLDLALVCRQVLVATGWRKNTSFHSDKGPVTFVVSKCLLAITNEHVTPAALGRQFRRSIEE